MKKSVLSILTFCFVFVGVLAFSVPVCAGSIEYSSPTEVVIDIDKSDSGFGTSKYPSNNVRQSIVSSSIQHTFFDFVTYAGQRLVWYDPDYLKDWDGLFVKLVDSSDVSCTKSLIGTIRLGIGNVNSSLVYKIATFGGSDKQPSAAFYIPFSEYGSGNFYFYVIGESAVVYVFGDSTNAYPSFSVKGHYTFSFSLYRRTYASSSDITNQTNSINSNIQKETQKQTDTMTNGYDNSSMSQDNTRLNDQISQYDQAQEETTNKSTAYIDGAEFVNPFSNATVLASVTFATSFLQSLFMNLDIWQLVVTVSLCLVLALMLVGWFKFRGD